MRVWEVSGFRACPECFSCAKHRNYRPLGTVIADSIGEAIEKSHRFEDRLADGETICLGKHRPVSTWDLLQDPQL
jgi:hypothetical protein